ARARILGRPSISIRVRSGILLNAAFRAASRCSRAFLCASRSAGPAALAVVTVNPKTAPSVIAVSHRRRSIVRLHFLSGVSKGPERAGVTAIVDSARPGRDPKGQPCQEKWAGNYYWYPFLSSAFCPIELVGRFGPVGGCRSMRYRAPAGKGPGSSVLSPVDHS